MTFTQTQTFKNRRVIDPNLYLIPDLVGIFFNQILIGATKTCHTTQTRPYPLLRQSVILPEKSSPDEAIGSARPSLHRPNGCTLPLLRLARLRYCDFWQSCLK
jgi:hypothetical protein